METKFCTKLFSYYIKNNDKQIKQKKKKKPDSLIDSVSAPVAVLPLGIKLPTSVSQQR